MTFALDDMDTNPHPRMLAGALAARAAMRTDPSGPRVSFWEGYLTAMVDATGATPTAIQAWMDRHA